MKQWMKNAAAVLCALALFIGIAEGLRYLLTDDTKSYTRITFHQLHDPQENADILFVGSSHCYRALNPELLDGYFQARTFNGGTSSQLMDGSLAMIQEAVACNRVQHIYLELYYNAFGTGKNKNRTQLTQTYILSDYMKPSLRRVRYLLEASGKEHYVNSFLVARRNWEGVFHWQEIAKLLRQKRSAAYRSFQWMPQPGSSEYYVDRGFVANDMAGKPRQWNATAYGPLRVRTVDYEETDWGKYLQRIIDFCKQKEIPLTFFVAPEPEWTLIGKENYDDYVEMLREIAAKNGLDYYDFNLIRPEYFDMNNRNFFKDEDHLNTAGAEAFSHLFGRFFTGELTAEEIFFPSFTEKLMAEPPRVYGLAGPYENPEEGVLSCAVISNRKDGLEYEITVRPEGGEERILQPFSPQKQFTLPAGESGKLTLRWRRAGQPETVSVLEASY